MLCGSACGCRRVVCVFAFRLRFLSAFLEGVCGRLMSFVFEVGFLYVGYYSLFGLLYDYFKGAPCVSFIGLCFTLQDGAVLTL